MFIPNDVISDNNNNFGLNTQTKLVEIPFLGSHFSHNLYESIAVPF